MPVVWDKNGRLFIDVDLEPSFSFFLMDNLELRVGPIFKYNIFATDERRQGKNKKIEWGVLFSARYFFDLGNNFFYVGLGATATVFDANFRDITGSILLPFGFLIPMNEYVAIDIGVPAKIGFSPQSRFNRFELPFGYFGLQAFF